ncbi:MAG: type VII secretion target [Chloroflexota bacterium]
MAVDEIFMDTVRLGEISTQFGSLGDILTNISNALEIAITVLETTAFIGLVGGTAVLAFLEQVQPIIEKAATKCVELSEDLGSSIVAYENGDAAGATKFF